MTYQEREAIISKELLDKNDMAKLCGVAPCTALEIIQNIKRKKCRIDIAGRVHIQDYIEYFGLDMARFVPKRDSEAVAWQERVDEIKAEIKK